MYSLIRPLLFKLDPEKAHDLALSALSCMPKYCFAPVKQIPVIAMGLNFPHPVGLAAGLDKNGDYLDGLSKIGFSFIELGTVTPKPQEGNAKPRLFRLPESEGIINRMGFNNNGVDALVSKVCRAKYHGILGINIGKNKNTDLNHAVEDYRYCLRKVYGHASYVTINISSPNTPDLRQLQQGDYFSHLLSELSEEQKKLSDTHQKHVPLVVKISPDETDDTLKQMADVILQKGIEGIIATNTTCSREMVQHMPHAKEAGGLSGRPIRDLSNHCLGVLKRYVGSDITLIGVGGVDSCASAQAKLDAGASLVQVYSGLIYQGPDLVSKIISGLNIGASG